MLVPKTTLTQTMNILSTRQWIIWPICKWTRVCVWVYKGVR